MNHIQPYSLGLGLPCSAFGRHGTDAATGANVAQGRLGRLFDRFGEISRQIALHSLTDSKPPISYYYVEKMRLLQNSWQTFLGSGGGQRPV